MPSWSLLTYGLKLVYYSEGLYIDQKNYYLSLKYQSDNDMLIIK